MSKTIVSVITPLYNAEKYISATIESVLSQTYKDFELIIVDDCSTDNSLEIAKRYSEIDSRIKVFTNEKNMGIAYTRNKAIRHSSGEFIAILDDDDLMLEIRLEKQVEFLENHPDVGAVGGKAVWIDENENVILDPMDVPFDFLTEKMYLCFRNNINNSEMTFRHSILTKNRIKYSENCLGMEDFKFWIEFSKKTKIMFINDVVLKRRMISSSQTSKIKKEKGIERADKFFELQKYSLELSGFIIDDEIEKLLRIFFGEEHKMCENLLDLSGLIRLLGLLERQTNNMEIKYCLHDWFIGLSEMQLLNVEKCSLGNKDYYFEWLIDQKRETDKYVEELNKGKEWLELQCENLKKCILDLKDK